MEHNSGNDTDRLRVDEELVSKRPRRKHKAIARVISVIDVGNRLKIEVNRGEYRHKREHGHSVGCEAPFQALARVIDGTEQGTHTLEEQNDNDP